MIEFPASEHVAEAHMAPLTQEAGVRLGFIALRSNAEALTRALADVLDAWDRSDPQKFIEALERARNVLERAGELPSATGAVGSEQPPDKKQKAE